MTFYPISIVNTSNGNDQNDTGLNTPIYFGYLTINCLPFCTIGTDFDNSSTTILDKQYEDLDKISSSDSSQQLNINSNEKISSNSDFNIKSWSNDNLDSEFPLDSPTNEIKKNFRILFTKEEDEQLKRLVDLFGQKNWTIISSFMNGRSPKQCRDRYCNYLVPGFFQGEWSKEEDDLLIKLYKENGSKWSLFKEHFPKRSPNSIKNRWHYFLGKNFCQENLLEEQEIDRLEKYDENSCSSNNQENKSSKELRDEQENSYDINEADFIDFNDNAWMAFD
ncbi:hypothetical protein M9Y10_003344 [Tritrichomonas musculus]|uniref:Myb-like DNA-binding domain containing protein n=1 Tax=Tritrichomonas musculus TaxID=1915356 RepID=A0ABR2JP68_9EUKA